MTTAEMNATFRDFALQFLGRSPVDDDIPFVGELARTSLDGSIESLYVVDAYLSAVQADLEELTDADYNNVVLRAGAYVGECIRMTWPESYDWCDYGDYISANPQMQDVLPERVLGTCALLLRKPDGMILPLNKVLRFLHEGPENSLHHFANCEAQYHS